MKACPHESIVFHQDGTPVIFPDQTPCYLCEDTPCIAACMTEALVPVSSVRDIRLGVAVVNHRLCTAGQGCHACVSKCPTDALTMDFDAQRLVVTVERCVGCGMCEQVCRAVNDHIAVKVTPFRLMESTLR
jgi:ferredoxin-type protein NapG